MTKVRIYPQITYQVLSYDMNFFKKLLVAILVAVILAIFSIWITLLQTNSSLTIQNGPWKTNLFNATKKAGMYHKAVAARYALWGLSSKEVVYFVTDEDSQGNPLDENCQYLIKGNDPPTRWWSVSIYQDYHMIENEINRYSLHSQNVIRNPDQSWEITISRKEADKNWLPSGSKPGKIVLALRCYNPEQIILNQPTRISLPQIIKQSCQ